MYWSNFLHIYQPPTQTETILRKVALECYRPLVKVLRENKSARVTLNINACLTEQLARYGFSDIIDAIGQLAQEGRVELTASAKYHPVLPLIPRGEIERQIELNQRSNEEYFKGVYRPKGFFPPEMCYSRELALILKAMGFEWVIVDEIAYSGKIGHYRNDRTYLIESASPLKVFLKERKVSSAIAFGSCRNKAQFEKLNQDTLDKDVYLITGTDGEIYGHHLPGQEELLTGIFQDNRIKTVTISGLNQVFQKTQTIEPLASSWSSWEDELEKGVPYPQWDDPSNDIHQQQWELARMVMLEINKSKSTQAHTEHWLKARDLMDQGLYSCQWWWASCRPWWGTDMPKKGVDLLMEALLSLTMFSSEHKVSQEANVLKKSIERKLDDWASSGKAKRLQNEYMQSHQEVNSLLGFG